MAEKEQELLCIGNAMVDVFARLEECVCTRFGITHPVQHIDAEKFIDLFSFISAVPGRQMVSGGGAANVAKIAGFLGIRVGFIGAIGCDDECAPDHFGRFFEESLTAAGVKLKLILKQASTGACLIICTDSGESRVAASPQAAFMLSENDISEDDIKNARLVVIDGFILNRPGLVCHILRLTERYGTVPVIDLGMAAIAAELAEEIADYVKRYSAFLFMNEAETLAFYNGIAYPEKIAEGGLVEGSLAFFQIYEFFKSFTKNKVFQKAKGETDKSNPVVIVKLGKRGALCFAGGEVFHARTRAIKPVESTGAGDAFCAGFLSAWLQGKDFSQCASMGNSTAKTVLETTGTQADRKKLARLSKLKLTIHGA
jgi:sugar/nucleoside kinase (ribokinase family)